MCVAGKCVADANFADVVLLMHFDGANGATSFVDVIGHTVTPVGAAAISTTTSVFGGASGYFVRTSDSYLTVPNDPDWNLSSGDSTIEMWIKPSDQVPEGLLTLSPTTNDEEPDLILSNNNLLYMQDNGGQNNLATSTPVTAGSWQHIAVVRSGTSTLLFINGVLSGSGTVNAFKNTTNLLYIGAVNTATNGTTYLYSGYMDELRITKGFARYTTNFTVPTTPFPNAGP